MSINYFYIVHNFSSFVIKFILISGRTQLTTDVLMLSYNLGLIITEPKFTILNNRSPEYSSYTRPDGRLFYHRNILRERYL